MRVLISKEDYKNFINTRILPENLLVNQGPREAVFSPAEDPGLYFEKFSTLPQTIKNSIKDTLDSLSEFPESVWEDIKDFDLDYSDPIKLKESLLIEIYQSTGEMFNVLREGRLD